MDLAVIYIRRVAKGWADRKRAYEVVVDGDSRGSLRPRDKLDIEVEQCPGEGTSFPMVDGHGDVTAIVGAAAEVESRQSFDPWGDQLSGPSVEMGYLGAWERPSDPSSGLVQMGARSYAPHIGAFATEDPVLGHLGIGVSSNRYPYAWNNPVNRFDLGGRDVLLGSPVCILSCGPNPEEVSERARDFAKSDSAEWFGASGSPILMLQTSHLRFRLRAYPEEVQCRPLDR